MEFLRVSKIDLPFGGDNLFGFPLTFYEMFSNEFRVQQTSAFNFPNFLIDLAIVIVLGIGTERAATAILRKLRKK